MLGCLAALVAIAVVSLRQEKSEEAGTWLEAHGAAAACLIVCKALAFAALLGLLAASLPDLLQDDPARSQCLS